MSPRADTMERIKMKIDNKLTQNRCDYVANLSARPLTVTEYIRETSENKGVYLILKRVMDVIGATFALLILFPLFIITALAIKLDSKGNVIYSQIRIGKNGRPFTMYKFRSMCQDADAKLPDLQNLNERDGPVFKITRDPRVTKVGQFIRATCIDELPQLVNILKGEMSIVGPRPPLPNEVAQYSSHHMKRLTITPGLTCYWQISDRQMTFAEWVESDLKYIRDQNLKIDLEIILKTVLVVFHSQGAK